MKQDLKKKLNKYGQLALFKQLTKIMLVSPQKKKKKKKVKNQVGVVPAHGGIEDFFL